MKGERNQADFGQLHPSHPDVTNDADSYIPRQSYPGTAKALQGLLPLHEMNLTGLSSCTSIMKP